MSFISDGMSWLANGLGFGNSDSVDAAQNYISKNTDLWKNNYSENQSSLNNYLNEISKNHDTTLKDDYDLAKSNYENLGTYNPTSFSYDKSVEDFMSPAVDMRVKTAQDAITNSQANAGNMFSSDYLNALNAKSQAIASEEYDKAYDRYSQDKSQALQEQTFDANQNKAAYDSKSDLYKTLMTQIGNDYNTDTSNWLNGLGDYYSGVINSNNAYTNGMANVNTSLANAALSENNGVADMLNFGLNAYNTFAAG